MRSGSRTEVLNIAAELGVRSPEAHDDPGPSSQIPNPQLQAATLIAARVDRQAERDFFFIEDRRWKATIGILPWM